MPDTEIPVIEPVPVPWLRMVMVAVVLALILTEGKLMAAPDESGWILPSASVYDKAKVGAFVDAVRVPEMELPARAMLNVPLKVPACVGAKTIPKRKLWPAGTVAGSSGNPLS